MPTRNETEAIVKFLCNHGVVAAAYHAKVILVILLKRGTSACWYGQVRLVLEYNPQSEAYGYCIVTFLSLLVQLPRAHLRQVHDGFHGDTLQVLLPWPLCNLVLMLSRPAPGSASNQIRMWAPWLGCTSTCPIRISVTCEDILIIAGGCCHYCIWNGNRQAKRKACDPLWVASGR